MRSDALRNSIQMLILKACVHVYYRLQEQRIVREEEWDAFMSVLRRPLPATFRINAR